MNILKTSLLLGLLGVCALAQTGSTTLKVGDVAPDFTMPSTTGGTVALSSFRGKQNVVLAFFPAAFTGGCTKEMQTYQLGLDRFKGSDAAVFGVSEDNTPSQAAFAAKLGLAFPLLSDFATRQVAQQYGVFNPERGTARRVTFVIDKDGRISFTEVEKDAIATTGAGEACSRLAHKTAGQ